MLEADWLEQYVAKQREQRTLAYPSKRQARMRSQTKRMESPRMRRVNGQTPNATRAMYQPEHAMNRTPTMPMDFVGTHEVGPGDVHNADTNWRTGKATVSRDGDGDWQNLR